MKFHTPVSKFLQHFIVYFITPVSENITDYFYLVIMLKRELYFFNEAWIGGEVLSGKEKNSFFGV